MVLSLLPKHVPRKAVSTASQVLSAAVRRGEREKVVVPSFPLPEIKVHKIRLQAHVCLRSVSLNTRQGEGVGENTSYGGRRLGGSLDSNLSRLSALPKQCHAGHSLDLFRVGLETIPHIPQRNHSKVVSPLFPNSPSPSPSLLINRKCISSIN